MQRSRYLGPGTRARTNYAQLLRSAHATWTCIKGSRKQDKETSKNKQTQWPHPPLVIKWRYGAPRGQQVIALQTCLSHIQVPSKLSLHWVLAGMGSERYQKSGFIFGCLFLIWMSKMGFCFSFGCPKSFCYTRHIWMSKGHSDVYNTFGCHSEVYTCTSLIWMSKGYCDTWHIWMSKSHFDEYHIDGHSLMYMT